MDPVTATSTIGDIGSKFGFPALLVLVLLWGIYKMQERADSARDKRDALDSQREEQRRAEREADRAAHIAALEKHGERLESNTQALGTLGQAVAQQGLRLDRIADAVEGPLRAAKGG